MTGLKKGLLLCLALGLLKTGYGQVNYIRSTFTGTYTPITIAGGATDVGFTTNYTTKSKALPFDIAWNGVPYTTANYLAICTNGFAFFSTNNDSTTKAASPYYLFTTSNLGPNTIIAPWFANYLSVNSTGGSGMILTQVTAPNEWTIQWTDVWASTSSSANPTTDLLTHRRINFQLKLYGSNHATKANQIEFCYGPIAGVRHSSEYAAVGLKVAHQSAGSNLDAVANSVKTGNAMMNTNQWPTTFFRFTPNVTPPTPLAAGTYTVGSGGSYTSLSAALADLNYKGIAGPVKFDLTDAVYDSTKNYFPLLLGPVSGASASNRITFESSLPTGSVISSPGVSAGNIANEASASAMGSSEDPVLGLIGSSYVTIRNLTFEAAGENTLVDRGLLVANSSGTNGASNDSIINVKVRLSRSNSTSIGIVQETVSTASVASGANSNNKYFNLRISNVNTGIKLSGTANFADQNAEVGILTPGDSTIIGANLPNDIGGNNAATYGVFCEGQNGLKLHHLVIRNITGNGSGTTGGISVVETTTNTTVRTHEIYNNRIYNLNQLNTSTSAGIVYGIQSTLSNNAATAARIYNNFVSGLNSSSLATTTRRIIGIYTSGSTNTSANYTFHVDFNTVIINPDAPNCSNTCFEIGSSTSGAISQAFNVRNNIFANYTAAQSGSFKHYCWSSSSTTSIGSGVSNRNILYVADNANGFTGRGNGSDFATLANWKSIASGVDVNSRSENPQFLSLTNYKINPSVATPVESNGSFFSGAISWAGTDIEGGTRNNSNPDIGAYEGNFTAFADDDVSPFAFINPANEDVLLNNGVSNAFKPVVRFKNNGVNPQTGIAVRYRITGPLPATTEVYNQARVLGALGSGATLLDTFPTITLSSNGIYRLEAITELAGDNVMSNDTLRASIVVSSPLSGNIAVGKASPLPYNTLTNAIKALNVCGVSAPVTFSLTDSVYSTNETFPLEIKAYAGAGATNPVTIKPASGVTARVEGSSVNFMVRLSDAVYVTIDGSNAVGGTTRDLAFINTNATANSGVIWISSSATGSNSGATNNTIKNCYLKAGASDITTTFGVYMAGTTISGSATGINNDFNTIQNNKIERAYRGIYARATSTSTGHYDNTLIADNEIGSNNPADYVVFRGIDVTNNNGLEIRNNRIFNLRPAENVVAIGIEMGANTRNTLVHRNQLDSIGSTSASATGAYGIAITSTSPNNVSIYNNFISNVAMNTGGTGTTNVANGIRIAGGSQINIHYNSVNMGGIVSTGSAATAALMVTVSSVSQLNVSNNVFVNRITGSSVKAYAVYAVSGVTFDVINYNAYYAAAPSGVLGFYGSDLTNMNQWRAATSQDISSFIYNPSFTSSSDLHVVTASPSALESVATPLAAITTDIDGDTRSAATPDIGADEFNGTPLDISPPGISFVPLSKTAMLTNRALTAEISDNSNVDSTGINKPRIYYKKSTETNALSGNTAFDNGWKYTEATNNSSPFEFTIDYTLLTGGSVSAGETIQYFVIASDLAASPNIGVNGAEFATTPSGVMLSVSDFPVTPVASYQIVAAIPATVMVGAGQTFTSLTAAGGLFEAINNRILASDVTVLITSDLSETGAVALNEYAEDLPGNYTITVKPDNAVVRTISGNVTKKSLINLNGTDRFVLDGRYNGSGNYLTIINNNTATQTGVISLICPGTAANPTLPGCEEVTIRNCNIVGGTMHNSSSYLTGFLGIYCGGDINGSSLPSAAFNNRFKVIGNKFARMATGIYLLGNVNSLYNEVTIDSNEFGTMKDDSTIFFQALFINNTSLSGLKVRNNVLRHFVQNHNTYSGSMYGMQISGCEKSDVSRNTIRDFRHLKGGYVYGMVIGTSSSSSDDSTVVHSNEIYDLYTSSTSSTVSLQGINIASKNLLVYHNSIHLFNSVSATNGGSACIYGAQSGTAGMHVHNNIISNTLTAAPAAKSYGLYMNGASNLGTSDHNNIFVPGGITARATAEYASLADWQSGGSLDLNSKQTDPLFNSDSNVVLLPSSELKAAAPFIPAAASDILGTARNNPATIGAYENAADYSSPVIVYSKLLNSVAAAQRVTQDFASITDRGGSADTVSGRKPRIYYKRSSDDNVYVDNTSASTGWKYAESFSTGSPFDFTIDYTRLFGGGPVTTSDTIQYFVIAQDTALTPNVSINTATLATPAASVNLSAIHFPVSGTLNSYLISLPMSGSYLVGIGGNFASLTGNGGAFEAINSSALSGSVELSVISDLTETGIHPLNQWAETGSGNYTVRVTPFAFSGVKQISGSTKNALIRIQHASRVTINGYDGFTSHALAFTNTDTGAVIQLTNQAKHDSILHVTLKGNVVSASNGLLVVSNNSDSIHISENLFAHGTRTPANSLYFGGNTGTNDYITVANNEISNFYANGIYVAASGNGSGWNITGNQFYHNTSADTASKTAINFLAGSLSENNTISGNVIGGQMANASGMPWLHNGTNAAVTFKGISVNAGSASSPVMVSGNTIRNIKLSGTAASMSFTGIEQLSGSNVVINGNTIGDSLTTDSIVIYGNASTAINIGISSVSTTERFITNNKIQGITSYGINNNNVIGINVTGSGKPNVTQNTIQYLYSAGSEVSQTTARSITGIFSGSDNKAQVIRKNTIRNLVSTGGSIPSGNASTIARGIMVNSSVSGGQISQNRIGDIQNRSTGNGEIHGIYFFTGASNARWTIDNNQIYLTNGMQNNAVKIEGIHDRNADVGREIAILYNTIYIGGTATSGTAASTCYQRITASGCTLQNNLFYNERTGGSGKHTAISNLVSPPTANWNAASSNYNVYVAGDTSEVIEWENTGSVIAPDSFKRAATSDRFSYFAGKFEILSGSLFTNIAAGDLSISRNSYEAWILNGKGKSVDTIAYSIDDSVRNTATGVPTDIGAEEFTPNFAPPILYPVVTAPSTPVMLYGRRLGTINWVSGTPPSQVSVQYYSGIPAATSVSGNKINSHMVMGSVGGSAYTFDLEYAYSPAETGTIPHADLRLAQTTDNGTSWNYFSASVVNTSQYHVTATGLNSFGTFTLTDQANPLPVKLLTFTAKAVKKDAMVSWSTASERNAAHFLVQASVDGKTFITVGQVKAEGSSNRVTAYRFNHLNAQQQMNANEVFYRLISVDRDGASEASQPVNVIFNSLSTSGTAVAYPNPFASALTLRISSETDQEARLEMHDMQGQLMMSRAETIREGINDVALTATQDMPPGVYFIRITLNNETQVIKVIKNQ